MNVEVVCSFYSALAYCIAIGVLSNDLALVPIRYRLLKTWDTVLPFLLAERQTRGDGESYFSLLEDMVGQAKLTDLRRSEDRLSRIAFPGLRARRFVRRSVVVQIPPTKPKRTRPGQTSESAHN